MKFLLTNDDGFDADGLQVLQQVAAALGDSLTVAPNQCFSGCGHQTTTHRPLRLAQVRPQQYRLDGTPADCTRLGVAHLAAQEFGALDWVLAGVNYGANLGADVYCSGTVAAVREAALLGLPGIAISQYRRQMAAVDWQRTHRWTDRVLKLLFQRSLPPRSYWNVNLPDPEWTADHSIGGSNPEIVFCAVDGSPMPVSYRMEGEQFHYSGSYRERPRQADSDVHHCFAGNITVSCITLL